MMTPAPFIVGVPRSGTTLLRLMLDAHPALSIPPKTNFLKLFLGQENQKIELSEFVRKIAITPKWASFGFEPEELNQTMHSLLNESNNGLTELLRALYLSYAQKHGKIRWGEKTGTYLKSMMEISQLLPEAHFIHIVRDGRAVVSSLKKAYFAKNKAIQTLASHWVNSISNARIKAQQLPYYLEVRYEDLVSAPGKELQNICSFIDLAYSNSMLCYFEKAQLRLEEIKKNRGLGDYNDADKKVAELFALTKMPPMVSRINAWKTELSGIEIAKIEHIAGPLLAELGYQI